MCKKRNICQRPSFSPSFFFTTNARYGGSRLARPKIDNLPPPPSEYRKSGGRGGTCVCVILPAAIPPFSLHLSIGSLQLFLSSSSSFFLPSDFLHSFPPPFFPQRRGGAETDNIPPLFPLPLQATSLTFTLFLYRMREKRVKLHIA